jgi:hypothetical protein
MSVPLGRWIAIVVILLFSATAFAAPKADYWQYWDKSREDNSSTVNHSELDYILRTYVVTGHPSGINRFRYGMVSRGHKKRLEDYIASTAEIDPRNYSKQEQLVYWLNLYNALTINLVLDNYPVDSIKNIKTGRAGIEPWDMKLVKVANTRLTLNDIEHRILRPIWQDHRIHFGLVCASLGCPNIQPAAFTSVNSRKLLSAAGREFVRHHRGLHLQNGKLQLSRIFDWYEGDFAANRKTLLKVFAHYAEDRTALYLLGFKGEFSYNYDWRINAP